eukprot:11534468-Karenia_brevis.AAC.1
MAGRTSHWPKPYTAYIRLWGETQGLEVCRQVAIMLPHETLLAIVEWCGDADQLYNFACDPVTQSHLEQQMERDNVQRAMAVGLWFDGVPYNYDRSQSIEMASMLLLGHVGRMYSWRFPLTAIDRIHVGPNTLDDICEVTKRREGPIFIAGGRGLWHSYPYQWGRGGWQNTHAHAHSRKGRPSCIQEPGPNSHRLREGMQPPTYGYGSLLFSSSTR